jgi:hypothetical protein
MIQKAKKKILQYRFDDVDGASMSGLVVFSSVVVVCRVLSRLKTQSSRMGSGIQKGSRAFVHLYLPSLGVHGMERNMNNDLTISVAVKGAD